MPLIEDLATANAASRHRDWVAEAVNRIAADARRSADTHLLRLALPGLPGIPLYLKDESTHPSGSLKHRLARSLFLYGLVNGWIGPETPIVEASSGSTAISEAYFARLLGLPFIAVVPETTAPKKIEQIEFHGGECRRVPGPSIYAEAAATAERLGGHYADQFTFAERATDWRGNNNIAESLFSQMALEPDPVPDWVVMSAGTGGTSATLGRYLRYRPELFPRTRLCVVDPENSVFFEHLRTGDRTLTLDCGSRIEGIGRPRVEPSFQRDVVDRGLRIPDAASMAALRWLEKVLGRKLGGSTGANLCGALRLAEEMRAEGRRGAVVTVICDGGDRYLDTYHAPGWAEAQGLDPAPWLDWLDGFLKPA
ncbi:MAG: PLP-dependent cysteine synthase family protein [Pseudomonadota bacterium]